MKSITRWAVISLLSATSSTVMACPDLRGTYLCTQNSYHQDILYHFDQSQSENHWLFSMIVQTPEQKVLASYEFLTAGIKREVADQVTGARLLLEAACEKDILKVQGEANYETPKPIRFEENLSRTTNGDLSNVSLNINGEMIQEICTRQSP